MIGGFAGAVALAEPQVASAILHHTEVVQGALRYDTEYPAMNYSGEAKHNRVARLQERLEKGEAKLQFVPGRGYLDSLIKNLDIDPSSQLLVYSKTSLQSEYINGATPRALYFNDDASVSWEDGAPLIEIVAMDSQLGPVFYSLQNHLADPPHQGESPRGFDREGSRCLNCHDRYGMMGGGVPIFVETSSLVDVAGLILKPDDVITVDDDTPIAQRWAGWYVTGHSGSQVHLGNIQVHSAKELDDLDRVRKVNLDSLDGLFDTKPYLTGKSDIVALLVLEHESTIYNMITRMRFRASKVKLENGQLSARDERMEMAMADKFLQALLFVGAAPLGDKITGSSGFDAWFQKQGPRDHSGRSLRELDLKTRLFKYPLSFLIYSPAFDAVPDNMRARIYQRLAQVLTGADTSSTFASVSAGDRKAILEILKDTKPQFLPYLKDTPAVARN
jgi:hypothetical protein